MSKQVSRKESISKLSIFNQINTYFRQYAIDTLQNRGIPDFYDSLTNVQKIIVMNTPLKSVKTLSVVGDCIKDNYAHGDSSLGQAINRLARPFSCSENILIGDGFFGTQIKPLAASPRYTSVYINNKLHEIITKYKHLIKKDVEGTYKSLPIDVPIGLLLPVIGIAVGYRTQILPRKLEHLVDFLTGKRTTTTPYFKNFNGTITQHNGLPNSWLIEGEIKIDETAKTIEILSLPPLMKYESFIKKIATIVNEFDGCSISNKSKNDVNIKLTFNKHISADFWEYVKERISKSNKLIVRECIVFVKNTQVLEYNSIEDYLLDFKNKNLEVVLEHLEYMHQYTTSELSFLNAKLNFLTWMLTSKHTDKEIKHFMNKYEANIADRLDNIKARNLSEDEIERTEDLIRKQEDALSNYATDIEKQKIIINNTDFTLHTKPRGLQPLIEYDEKEIDGIEISNIEEYETFTSADVLDDEDITNELV